MASPNTPAIAGGPIFPPVANVAFVIENGYLSPAALQFLQFLWASIAGNGGVIDQQDQQPESPGLVTSLIRGIQEEDVRSQAAIPVGQLAALEQMLRQPTLAAASNPDRSSPSPVLWKPVLVGSTTSGAQTYAVQSGLYAEFGPMSVASFSVTLTALDAATAGNLQIAGLPRPANDQQASSGVLGAWGNLTLTTLYTQLGLSIAPASANIALLQDGSLQAPLALPVTGGSSTMTLSGTVTYFR